MCCKLAKVTSTGKVLLQHGREMWFCVPVEVVAFLNKNGMENAVSSQVFGVPAGNENIIGMVSRAQGSSRTRSCEKVEVAILGP